MIIEYKSIHESELFSLPELWKDGWITSIVVKDRIVLYREKPKTRTKSKAVAVSFNLDAERFPALAPKMDEYLRFRKESGKPMKEASLPAFLKKLTEYSGWSEAEAVAILEQSIANGWQGIFPTKEWGKPRNKISTEVF